MSGPSVAELWEWAEYYCPWCYVMASRMHRVLSKYAGRVLAYTRFFPLELFNGEAPHVMSWSRNGGSLPLMSYPRRSFHIR